MASRIYDIAMTVVCIMALLVGYNPNLFAIS